jgi:hypothetical protein
MNNYLTLQKTTLGKIDELYPICTVSFLKILYAARTMVF